MQQMKAEELMIGDWICVNDYLFQNEFAQVCQIGDCKCFFIIQGRESHAYYPSISPVSLTAEILKANGYAGGSIMLDHMAIDIKHIGANWAMCISQLEETDTFSVKTLLEMSNLQHVHELQHALRLCGLNDLANNFKIN